MTIEKTLSIIKPNAVQDHHIGAIIALFEKNNLKISAMKMTHLTKEKAQEFYAEHSARPFFNELVTFMISSPVVLMVLEGESAVQKNRDIMGATNPEAALPGTIRKLYARSLGENAVHGSDSSAAAAREIACFFAPNEIMK